MEYGKYEMNSRKLSRIETDGYQQLLSSATSPTTIFEEIDQHVITQCFRGCEEGTTMVDLGHLLNEMAQWACRIKHKCVDGEVVLCASHGLTQCGFHGLTHWRIVEVDIARLRDVGRWFTISDHDDLLGAGLASK